MLPITLCLEIYLRRIKIALIAVMGEIAQYHTTWPLQDVFELVYRTFHSAETALLRIFIDIVISSGNVSYLLSLLDLRAEFDNIDHNIL